jgi:hypothetical protein
MPEHVLASPSGWLQRFAADVDVPPAADYERLLSVHRLAVDGSAARQVRRCGREIAAARAHADACRPVLAGRDVDD